MDKTRITLIGSGVIGLSFGALHLGHNAALDSLTIFDPRPDISDYVRTTLPGYLPSGAEEVSLFDKIRISNDLEDAVKDAHIVQEQGPENLEFKSKIWPEIEAYAPSSALFWSSTSGIPASAQSRNMRDPSRLLVVHPYNPPHIMPLLEVVPSPSTSEAVLNSTLEYWERIGRRPVVIKKECTGFVANRLAFALLREGIHLVNEGVVSVEEIDEVVQNSMGPRWAIAGPFKSYHAGGGKAGLEGFFANIGKTVQACWDDAGQISVGDGWEDNVFSQTKAAYGEVDVTLRDRMTRRVLQVINEEKRKS